ncbi:hypothetical protein ACFOOM_01185 [Streptomyces echinoruber]|uniref:Uncharacterized protein n=1 Tax=Streptomyces echinoruber TaxID=68898 RepID=A0A918QVR7_9ACTN|nr:hypothetical protein [Streptomyces echinoruber]GGZ72970.1 hypothetical protein GCM10010389_07960 [Streptomyces echinoruber]
MTQPSSSDMDRARHEISNALLAMTDLITPIFDKADGMRADLERRGWSPTAAEQVALVWLLNAVNSATNGGATA